MKWEYLTQVVQTSGLVLNSETLTYLDDATRPHGANGWEMVGFQQMVNAPLGIVHTYTYKRPVL